MLGYVILIILLMTLNPFYVAPPKQITLNFDASLDNLIFNIILFIPVGFLYSLATNRRGALFFGAGLSIIIELTQLFLPARTTSIADVFTNTLGAGLGDVLYQQLASRLNVPSGMIDRMRLQTPLMGLTYLAIPLLWIDTLALNEAPLRWLLTAFIALCGAVVFSNLFRNWAEGNSQTVVYASLASGIWLLIGIGPGLRLSKSLFLLIPSIMLLTALLATLPRSTNDRRIERITLKQILPIFSVYLLLLSLWFPLSAFGTWHGFFGFTGRSTEPSVYALYPRLEYLAAFTVLGYMIAEWRGRLELSLGKDLPRLLLIATIVALVLELLSGFQSGRGASLIRFVLSVMGAGFGGMIYHLSRAHIRFLLGR